ncbi:S8 family serine peptidase [Dactylosporangium sp. CA-233914]|uniref:S8 family serine peptidase n=1 Tax=Dactylosporangium sp. CA-233914 TaxID=3239934 RepID=UPI003D8C4EB7
MTDLRLFRRSSTIRIAVMGGLGVAIAAVATTSALAGPTGKAPIPAGDLSLKPHALNAETPAKATSAPIPVGKFRPARTEPVADSYIVVLKNSKASTAQVTQSADGLTRAHRGKVDTVYSKSLRGFTTTMSEADARRLAEDPDVAYVEQNRYVHASDVEVTKTPYYGEDNLWALDRIDQAFLPLDHRYHYSGEAPGVHVYVIDTGTNQDHSEYSGNAGFKQSWSTTKWTPEQITKCGNSTDGKDDYGHGQFVASEIVGQTFGVAKRAPVESVKVLDCKGEGTVDAVIEGVEHVTATAIKPAVANMSLGAGPSKAIDDAVKASIASGVTYVVSAGNDNIDACNGSPSRVPEAITVGATDLTDFRASFSNYGPCVDIFAPGVNVEGASMTKPDGTFSNIGWTYASGTSMAAPLVAGAAALLLQAHPTWTPAQVRAAIVEAGISGTVRNAGPGSPTKLLRTGEAPAAPTTFGLRAHANDRIVTADGGGTKPLIANRYSVGAWEGLTVVDAGDGAHVALRSGSNGKYVTADAAGAQPLIASGSTVGAGEKFTLEHNADGSVSLKAAVNGQYVTADNGGNGALIANRSTIGPWEEFDPAGPSADVFIAALANGKAVTADNGGNSPLIANRNAIGDWEQFDVVDAGGGYMAFIAHANGRFVTADNGGSRPLIANRTSVGDWEKFAFTTNRDGSFSLLACANGRYVTADNGGNSALIANRTAVGGTWERFVLYSYDELLNI